MLNNRNLKITRPNKSLNHKNLEPFKIIKAINNSVYELNLLKFIKETFLVFHP